jgi:hypothetical protein
MLSDYSSQAKESVMIVYDGDTVINRPVAEVFEYATTFENFPEWSDTTSVTRLTNGAAGPGTRLRLDMGKGPMRSKIDFDTVGWEQDRSWAFKTVSSGPIVWDGMYGFEPMGPSTTKVTASGQVTLRGWRRVLEPLVRAELRKGEQAELETLKQLLESRAGS